MRRTLGALLWCLGIVAAPLGPAAPADVAMLTSLQGTVAVRRAGQSGWRAASLMALLNPGDAIRTGARSAATLIFFADGHREKLLAGTSGTVMPTALRPLRGSRRVPITAGQREPSGSGRILVFPGSQPLTAGYVSAAGRPGAVALRADLALLSPTGHRVRPGRPDLRWTDRDGADAYRLRIFRQGEEPPQEVVSLETNVAGAPYPQSAPALQAGATYRWELEALSQGIVVARASGELTVLDAEADQALRREEAHLLEMARTLPEETTAPVLLAALYTQHGLYGEAIEQYRRVLAQRPRDRGVHFELGWLCRHVGLEQEARAHFTAAGVDPANPPLQRE